MLKTLTLKNFTVFPTAELEFSPGLNVIVGENGTGKSHLLKLGYAVLRRYASDETTEISLGFSSSVDLPLRNIFSCTNILELVLMVADSILKKQTHQTLLPP